MGQKKLFWLTQTRILVITLCQNLNIFHFRLSQIILLSNFLIWQIKPTSLHYSPRSILKQLTSLRFCLRFHTCTLPPQSLILSIIPLILGVCAVPHAAAESGALSPFAVWSGSFIPRQPSAVRSVFSPSPPATGRFSRERLGFDATCLDRNASSWFLQAPRTFHWIYSDWIYPENKDFTCPVWVCQSLAGWSCWSWSSKWCWWHWGYSIILILHQTNPPLVPSCNRARQQSRQCK